MKIGARYAYAANRNLALLSKMFGRAVQWGYLPEDGMGISKFREKSREPDELPRLMNAIEAEPNVCTRAALMLYLLTGVRKSELLSAQWEHVDLERTRSSYLKQSPAVLTSSAYRGRRWRSSAVCRAN